MKESVTEIFDVHKNFTQKLSSKISCFDSFWLLSIFFAMKSINWIIFGGIFEKAEKSGFNFVRQQNFGLRAADFRGVWLLEIWAFRMPEQPSRYASFGSIASIYFHLHHMNMSILNLNEFFRTFSIISDAPSPNHRWPKMAPWDCHNHRWGPLRLSLPSVNCTGTFRPVAVRAVRAHSGPDCKLHRFDHNCEEMLLWKLRTFCRKNFWLTMNFWFFMT